MSTFIKGNRVIAIFDILGFGALVRSKKLEILPSLLDRIVNYTESSVVTSDFIGYILFSDTIILFGKKGDYIAEPALLIMASSNLLNVFARNGILLRGALTYGEVYIDLFKNTIIGPALIKGYELEKSQDWSGAIIDPDNFKLFENSILKSPLPNNLTVYPAPLKSGKRLEYGCIGWMHRAKLDKEKIYNLFFPNKSDTPDHYLYRKYLNTYEFFKFCKRKYPELYNYVK